MTSVLIIANILGLLTSLIIYSKKKFSLLYKFFITIFIFYTIIIFSTYMYEIFLHYQLNSFDIDGDGIFSDTESTQAQQEVMSLVVNDAGRKMIYVTGLINSIVCALIIHIVYFVFSKIRNRY